MKGALLFIIGGIVLSVISYKKGCIDTNKSMMDKLETYKYTYYKSPKDDANSKGLIFDTRKDAQEVLDAILNIHDEYGKVTIADLYICSGLTPEFTDTKYGWKELNNVAITRTQSGDYMLELPKSILLS